MQQVYAVYNVYIYIYIIFTPNLGLGITGFDWEREHGSTEGALRSTGEHRGSIREHEGAVGRSKGAKVELLVLGGAQHKRVPDLTTPYSVTAAHVIDEILQQCCLARPAARIHLIHQLCLLGRRSLASEVFSALRATPSGGLLQKDMNLCILFENLSSLTQNCHARCIYAIILTFSLNDDQRYRIYDDIVYI